MSNRANLLVGVGIAALIVASGPAKVFAQAPSSQDMNAQILQRLEALERENKELREKVRRVEGKVAPKAADKSAVANAAAARPAVAAAGSANGQIVNGSMVPTSGSAIITTSGQGYVSTRPADADEYFNGYLKKKPGPGLTFVTPGGSVTLYGQFDISVDDTTKGIGNKIAPQNGLGPVGNVGWQPAISTNISYVGVKGEQQIDDRFNFLYQLETQIDISATSGWADTTSNQSNVVKGALTSRNSFIGIGNAEWGAIKVGKTDAPYKTSTSSFNPFSGMLGDYQVIMGNTGGDNRVEFGTRLDHSIWWESPNNWGGLKFAALFSPGQNRATDSSDIASGESDRAGGNSPLSGGNVNSLNPSGSCNDGSYSDAVSLSATYEKNGFIVLGAYERHFKVNRSSDIVGIYGDPGNPANGYNAAQQATITGLYNQDVADEDAFKLGLQYKFASKTTVSAIWESMHRYVASDLAFQNERQRNGTWLAIQQGLTEKDELDLGWAHAFRTPGDPGQHNDATVPTPDGLSTVAGPNPQNQADMITAALKHKFSPALMGYVDYAATINGKDAHYDLGAGGRGLTTDCHDATGADGGAFANPHCWTGGRLQGVSVGLQYKF